jgi:hypothetical protein
MRGIYFYQNVHTVKFRSLDVERNHDLMMSNTPRVL